MPASRSNLLAIFSPLENCQRMKRIVMRNKYNITANNGYTPYNLFKRNITLSSEK